MTIKIRSKNGVRIIKCKPKNGAEWHYVKSLMLKVVKKGTLIIL